jgi:hypothetical protein
VVLLWPADALAQPLLDIGFGDDNHGVGERGRELLQQDVHFPLGKGHVAVEAPPVNGVDDDGDAGQTRRQSPDHAGFGTVRVDDGVVLLPYQAGEFPEGQQIVLGIDLAQQLGQDSQRDVARADLGDEAAFAARLRPGEDFYVEARRVEERGSEHGVLLRPADDQAGDDVQDRELIHSTEISSITCASVGVCELAIPLPVCLCSTCGSRGRWAALS